MLSQLKMESDSESKFEFVQYNWLFLTLLATNAIQSTPLDPKN